MKKFYLLLSFWVLQQTLVSAQDYRGENKVFFNFEKKDKTFWSFESNKLTIEVDREYNSFFFDVNLDTFTPYNTIKDSSFWDVFFQKEFYGDVTYKGDIPSMVVDIQSDKKQIIEVHGILHLGDAEVELPLKIEWVQMDRFIFIDFDYKINIKDIGITIPDKFVKDITGNIYIEVVNAKLMGGFK